MNAVPPGPKGSLIMGVMREFNRDTLGFVTRCRDYGDVVHTRFLYVHAYFLYNPNDIESLLTTTRRVIVRRNHCVRRSSIDWLATAWLRAKAISGDGKDAWPSRLFIANASARTAT